MIPIDMRADKDKDPDVLLAFLISGLSPSRESPGRFLRFKREKDKPWKLADKHDLPKDETVKTDVICQDCFVFGNN